MGQNFCRRKGREVWKHGGEGSVNWEKGIQIFVGVQLGSPKNIPLDQKYHLPREVQNKWYKQLVRLP